MNETVLRVLQDAVATMGAVHYTIDGRRAEVYSARRGSKIAKSLRRTHTIAGNNPDSTGRGSNGFATKVVTRAERQPRMSNGSSCERILGKTAMYQLWMDM